MITTPPSASSKAFTPAAPRKRGSPSRGLTEEKRALELAAIEQRVAMDVRVAYYELLLNRAKIEVRQQSVGVMRDELKVQQERLLAGTVGELNVRRAEVSLANEQPELFEAQTRVQNSYLRLNELLGLPSSAKARAPTFEPADRLEYQARRPDLTESLGHAAAARPEIRARQIDVEIEEQQLIIDRSELRPRVDAFTGYEVYSERDPLVGDEFNHGYVVGLNASWHIFDGFATRGRMQATRARREAALAALAATQASVETDVRSAFFDLAASRSRPGIGNAQRGQRVRIARSGAKQLERGPRDAARCSASRGRCHARAHDAFERDLFAQRGARPPGPRRRARAARVGTAAEDGDGSRRQTRRASLQRSAAPDGFERSMKAARL